jgi:hypothetical protein
MHVFEIEVKTLPVTVSNDEFETLPHLITLNTYKNYDIEIRSQYSGRQIFIYYI